MALEFFENFEIQEFLFHEVLRVDRGSALITGDIGKDILFVLIIPSILGILVIRSLMKRAIGETRGGLATMVGIAALGFIIYGGWYTLLAESSVFIFALWLFISVASWGYHAVVGETGHKAIMFGANFLKKKADEKGLTKDAKKAIAKVPDYVRRAVNGYQAYFEARDAAYSPSMTGTTTAMGLRDDANRSKSLADQALAELEKMKTDFDESEEILDAIKKAYSGAMSIIDDTTRIPSAGNKTMRERVEAAVKPALGI